MGEVRGVHYDLAVGRKELFATVEESWHASKSPRKPGTVHKEEYGVVASCGAECVEVAIDDLLDPTVSYDACGERRYLECLNIKALFLKYQGMATSSSPNIEYSSSGEFQCLPGVPAQTLLCVEEYFGRPQLVVEAFSVNREGCVVVAFEVVVECLTKRVGCGVVVLWRHDEGIFMVFDEGGKRKRPVGEFTSMGLVQRVGPLGLEPRTL